MYENIKYEVNEGLAIVTINRPKAMNALNMDVLSELLDVFTAIEKDDAVKGVLLTGEGRAFVAGADIAQMCGLNALEGREMMMAGHNVMNKIEQLPKPVVAAVNGFALGGGCELAMACDIRIASDKAKFGQPEVGLGIISKAPIAVATAISAINNGFDMDMKSASVFEIETFTAAFASEDKKEGMTAFLEKRPAEFKNK